MSDFLQVTLVFSTVWNCVAMEVKQGGCVSASSRTLHLDHLPQQPATTRRDPLKQLALRNDGERALLIRTADEDWGVLLGTPAMWAPCRPTCDPDCAHSSCRR